MTPKKEPEEQTDDRYNVSFQDHEKNSRPGRYDITLKVIKTIEKAIEDSNNGTVKISLEDFKKLIGYTGQVSNIGRWAWYINKQFMKPKGLFLGAIKSENAVYLSKL